MATQHALLLTDVVDSARLTEALGDAAMAELWSAHDRIARDLLPAWSGREIDKSDGMLVLFDRADDAVGYALDYHRALAARGLPLKARAGIHVGPLTLHANSADDMARGARPIEVRGIALPTAARVMAVALGGQTLLSVEARLALGAAPRTLQSHGHWRLQGIAEPVELFEVVEDGAPFRAPPDGAKAYRVARQGDLWLPVREIRHSVPAERDSFVGRHEALRELAARFDAGARLVSLTGTGGTGKTRLASRFAWTRLGDYPGGAWFCDLSQARSADGIHFAVAHGLDVQLGRAEPVAQLAQAIAGRGRCLVILDNFEQVAAHAEATIGVWLDRAPQAHFVVTTREVLGIAGEEVLALAPLGGDEAAELFLRRAAAARHDFAASASERGAIETLVRVLDGLPLAIELAAARVRVLPPSALLARMHDRFEVLRARAGRRDRQATLRATFDWSWELLGESEKSALARLSVFEGGFTIASAAAVLDAAAGDGPSTVDLLQSLVDKSFVRRVSDDRFDLLESLREYAAQHLRAEGRFAGSGPGCEAAARAGHWRYFAGLDERAAIAGRCIEANNLVAACRAAARAGDAGAAASCLANAWAALRLTGPYRAAVELAQTVGAIEPLADEQRAVVHWVAGGALDAMGEVVPARAHFAQGLACAERAGATVSMARLLLALGSRQTIDGDLDAAARNLDKALRLAVRLGDASLQALALNMLGRLMDHQSRVAEARDYYERALQLARDLDDRRLEGGLLGNLGGLHHDLGEIDEARRHYERAIALASEVGDQRWEGNAHSNLGLLYQEQGRTAQAREQFDRALAIARATGHVRLEYTVLCNLGILLTAEGRPAEAAEHLQRAIDAATVSADRRSEGQFRGYLALAQARQGRLDEARESLRIGEQLLLAVADRLSHALLLCDRAEVELAAARPREAAAAIDEAQRAASALNCGPESDLRRRLAALNAALKAADQAPFNR